MFQFPGLPLPSLCVQLGVTGNDSRRVAPFGDPRVIGYVPLTAAYRSLSRPSSASSAKASTVCPYHLLLDGSGISHTARAMGPRAIRCDLLEKENIVFVTLCSSQGTQRENPQDRILRPFRDDKDFSEMTGTALIRFVFSRRGYSP